MSLRKALTCEQTQWISVVLLYAVMLLNPAFVLPVVALFLAVQLWGAPDRFRSRKGSLTLALCLVIAFVMAALISVAARF